MASHNQVIILSSSPPRHLATHHMSSSPLPSPSQLFQKQPTMLRVGSHAAMISPSASASFTTASALLRDTKIKTKETFTADTNKDGGMEDREITKGAKPRAKKALAKKAGEESKPLKAARKPKASATTDESIAISEVKRVKKKPVTKSEFFAEVGGEQTKVVVKKPRAKKVDKETIEEVEVASTKTRAKKVDKEMAGEAAEAPPKKSRARPVDKDIAGEPKAKVVRKPRAKKPIDVSQGLFPESNVTKPTSKPKKSKDDVTEEQVDFGLLEAVKRKTTWTPPVPTAMEVSITPASALIWDKDVELAGVETSDKKSKGLSNLFSSFGFMKEGSSARSSAGDSVAATTKAQNQAVIRKRKLIELVTTCNADGSISPTKNPPKKKPRTITERATAAYAEEDDVSMEPTPLMQYFSVQSKDKASNDEFKVPAKARSRSPTKKGTKQAPILLSPESAMKQVSKQDFVFGTSSQLAREESPTLLRDLHRAMQASPEQADPYEYLEDPSTSSTSKKGNLWNAASRGADGELLDIEVVDVIESITKVNPVTVKETDDWLDIDEVTQSKNVKLPVQETEIREVLPSSPLPRKSRKSPTPKPSQRTKSSPAKVTKVVSSHKQLPQMPLYSSYTTAQLAKEIASYRFKPIKSRDGMIIMLERCWEGKHRTALQSLDTNLPKTLSVNASKPSTSSPASPKRAPGRPKKASSAATSPAAKPKLGRPKKDSSVATSPAAKVKPGRPKKTAATFDSILDHEKAQTPKKTKKSKPLAEEISDSDSPLTPSPPRRRSSQVGKPPSPLQLRTEDFVSSPERTSSQTQALLFEHITKAVTGAPPSKESNNPTWYEKILLYDPIILEDLAIWLNTGALGTVGWDGEVAPAEVKKWCESKSICCLWKENLRGGARSRY